MDENYEEEQLQGILTENVVTHLSMCSGYEGMGRGLRGIFPNLREIAYVEREGYCCANLVAKIEEGELSEAPIFTDVKEFPYGKFRGCVDILSAGFPCQPFSSSGVRKGTEDPRHLFPFIADGVRLCKPNWVALENVEGIISCKFGGEPDTSVLKYVMARMEEIGYEGAFTLVSASEEGAPHQRKRVFMLFRNADPDTEIERGLGDTERTGLPSLLDGQGEKQPWRAGTWLHVQGKLSTNGKNQESSWPTPRTGKTDGTPESERNRQSKSLSAIALTEEATIQSKGVSGKAWATPSTMDTLPPKTGEALARNKKKGGCKNLREDVVNPEMNPEIMYPTPRTVDAEGGLAPNVSVENGRFVRTNAKGEKYSPKLRDAVETMEAWATPQASDHVEGARTSTDSNQKCLGRDMARLSQWGTPAVYDHVKNPASEVNSNQASIARNLGRLSIHGKLNPSWVESLMGLPKNTTLLPKSWLSECQDLDS